MSKQLVAKRKCVVFVDMVGSTRLKYELGASVVARLCSTLFRITHASTKGRENIAFTGDGAMVLYDANGDSGSRLGVEAAERIIQAVDRHNLQFVDPPFQVRVGIATGRCYVISDVPHPEVTGRTPDTAARLCAESDEQGVLLDAATRRASLLPAHRFQRCERRLGLKGIPLIGREVPDEFYHLKCRRLVSHPVPIAFEGGLLALFPDRLSLARAFSPARLLRLAWPGTTVVLAGRTLVSWTCVRKEMLASARDKAIKFRLLILRDAAAGYLDKQQQDEIARDLQSAKEHFVDLVTADPEHFDLRLTDHVLLDGLANVMITLPGPNDQTEPDPTLLVVHDINVYPAEGKASLALVSPGRKHPGRRGPGLALGLSDRTVRMLEMSEPPPPSVGGTELQRLIRAHSDGLSARRNTPGQYIHLLPPYLEAVRKGSFGECPAPICVQLQITTRCSTRCVMCQHCSVENPHLFPRK